MAYIRLESVAGFIGIRNYEEQAGMLVPLDGEVAWLLPEGAKPYWQGHIVELSYVFAR